MWDILALVDTNAIMLISALWVACMSLPSGRITRGPCEVLNVLLQGVSTLVQFGVAPVCAMPCIGLLFCGFPLQLLQLLLDCFKYSSMLVISLLSNLSLYLSILLFPNRHASSGMPLVLPSILFKDVSLSLWPSYFMKQTSPSCPITPWVHQYFLLHQFPFL